MADVFVGKIVEAIKVTECDADSEIVVGKNIEASERKDQKHLRGPHADAFDLDQRFDDFVVGKPCEPVETKAAVRNALGKIVQILCLLR